MAAARQPGGGTYRIIDLGPCVEGSEFARAVARDGGVAGRSLCVGRNVRWRAAVARRRGLRLFAVPPGCDSSVATAGRSGWVVGYGRRGRDEFAMVWHAGNARVLPALTPGGRSRAYGVNGSHEIVGVVDGDHPALWKAGNLHILPNQWSLGRARAINDAGDVVGSVGTAVDELNPFGVVPLDWERAASRAACGGDAAMRATLWSRGETTRLPMLPGYVFSDAKAINGAGRIAGVVFYKRGGPLDSVPSRAVVWYAGHVRSLGALPGETKSSASAVNDRGEAVGKSGERAFVYRSGRMLDLNRLIQDNPGWRLAEALSINNAGEILARGTIRGIDSECLLEPATLRRNPNFPARAPRTPLVALRFVCSPIRARLALAEDSANQAAFTLHLLNRAPRPVALPTSGSFYAVDFQDSSGRPVPATPTDLAGPLAPETEWKVIRPNEEVVIRLGTPPPDSSAVVALCGTDVRLLVSHVPPLSVLRRGCSVGYVFPAVRFAIASAAAFRARSSVNDGGRRTGSFYDRRGCVQSTQDARHPCTDDSYGGIGSRLTGSGTSPVTNYDDNVANELVLIQPPSDPGISFAYVGLFGYLWDNPFYYVRARCYDPTTGRWYSRDSGDSNSAYVYALNSPIMFIDPLGMAVTTVAPPETAPATGAPSYRPIAPAPQSSPGAAFRGGFWVWLGTRRYPQCSSRGSSCVRNSLRGQSQGAKGRVRKRTPGCRVQIQFTMTLRSVITRGRCVGPEAGTRIHATTTAGPSRRSWQLSNESTRARSSC
jgi:RHS repeat-associated protein